MSSFLDAFPPSVKLTICVLGIWICFFVYGILQESIWSYKNPETKERFTQTMVLLCIEHGVSALLAFVLCGFGGALREKWDAFPKKSVLIVACAQCGAKFASNEALKSVSYPIQALAKSSKTLPAMMGCLWSGKAITKLQWVTAIFITLGTATFSMVGKKKGSDIKASPLGVTLLVISLMCDGTVSASQEAMRHFKGKKGELSPYEQMFLTNLGAALILLTASGVFGQLQSGATFLLANLSILDAVLRFAVCSALGQVFIFLTINWFGPDTNAKITTIRKMATVLISILWFGHSMVTEQWLAVGVVFLAVLAEIGEKLLKGSSHHKTTQTAEKKVS